MEITFNIANKCNLKCTYCIFVGKGSGKEVGADMFTGLNQLLSYYSSNRDDRLSLTFSGGGEPLMYFKDIKKIVESIDIKNAYLLDVYIITNGTFYNKEISEFVRKHNIFLVLSLDGLSKTHNTNRVLENGGDSFDLVMKNKGLLFEDVQDVNYTIYHNNFFELVEGVEFIAKSFVRLRRLNFNFVFNTNTWSDDSLMGLKRSFDTFLDYYTQNQLYRKFETNLRNYAYYQTLESEDSCLGHLYINRDGNVFKCGAYEFNFAGKPLGNLYETKGEDIDFLRKNVKNCSSKCHQGEYDTYNKKLSLILFYIGKKYQIVDKFIDNAIRKYNY